MRYDGGMEPTKPPSTTCPEAGCNQPVRSKGKCNAHYRQDLRKQATTDRSCIRCGQPIPPSSGGRRRQYCNDECRKPKANRERTTYAACIEPGCERYPNGARGYCRPCYHQHKNVGHFGGEICTEEACERLTYGHGLCRPHLWAAQERGDIERPKCSVEGCDRPSRANSLCHRHLMRVRTHGEPGEAEARRRAKGEGHISKAGYIDMSVQGRKLGQHRYVMEQHLGRELHPWEHVHHRNGRRADNRLENLELWVAPSKHPGLSARQPNGQRPEDLAAFLVAYYPDIVKAEQRAQARERRTGQMRLVQ